MANDDNVREIGPDEYEVAEGYVGESFLHMIAFRPIALTMWALRFRQPQ